MHLVDFMLFHTRETTFVTCSLSCMQIPFYKGSTHKSPEKESVLKKKEFAPMGSKFFPFRIDFFSEGGKDNFDSCFT